MRRKFLTKLILLLSVLVCALLSFSLVACASKAGTDEHTHTFNIDKWSYNKTHHWHAANCGHEVKDEDCNGYAVHNMQNGECLVCDYFEPLSLEEFVADYITTATSFVTDEIRSSVIADKQEKAEYYYIVGNENDELAQVNIVYFYQIDEIERGVELATVTLPSPVPFRKIVNDTYTLNSSSLNISRTDVFEFDAKINYNKQNIATALFEKAGISGDIALYNEIESGENSYRSFQLLEQINSEIKVHRINVLKGDGTDDALLRNINRPYTTNSILATYTIGGTIIYDLAYALEDIDANQAYKIVTFNPNGGSCSEESMKFKPVSTMTGLPTPILSGYRFLGWYDGDGQLYDTTSVMPNRDLELIARWGKIVSAYDDSYVSLKPATSGVKNSEHNDYNVDQCVYIEITSDDLVGGVGAANNFTLRTLDSMEYSVKEGYTWTWYYDDEFANVNGAQRFTLNYGSNLQFVTVNNSSGVTERTYLIDIYVLHDYYINLYKSIYDTSAYTRVRVVENEILPESTPIVNLGNFAFDTRVYYNEGISEYAEFDYSTAITKDWNLYQTYKSVTMSVELNDGILDGVTEIQIKPYTPYVTLPVPQKDGYDFFGWKIDNKYFATLNGDIGTNYISETNASKTLTAVFEEKKYHYTFSNDTLRTYKTMPVVTYKDKSISEILEVLYVPYNTDCAAPTITPQTANEVFYEWATLDSETRTLIPFDFKIKITEPIALIANMVPSEYTGSILPLNKDVTYSQGGTYIIYLPTGNSYILKITTTGQVFFTVDAYGIRTSASYSAVSNRPASVELQYFYSMNEYTAVSQAGYITFRVTSFSKTFTVSVQGKTYTSLGEPMPTSGDNLVAAGEAFTVSPTKPGYAFKGWYDGDEKVADTESLIMSDEEIVLVAKCVKVTVDRNNASAGGVTGLSGTYKVGENVTITATTNSGYTWVGWFNGEQQLTSELSYSFDIPAEDTTYTAKWIQVTLDRSDISAGSITSLNGKYKVGDSVTVTASTNSGYTWVGWYNGETELTKELSYTFDMPSESVAYTAKWTYYTLTTVKNDSSAGTITAINSVKTTAGTSVTVTATTNSGYTWVGWYNGETELTKELSYPFDMPSESVIYTAKWIKVTLAISNSSAGSITSLSDRYKANDIVTITATLYGGYTFFGWYNGETELTKELSYTFAMPSENVTYVAKCDISEEMSNFTFTSTATSCNITGIKDKTVTNIVVPNYVTELAHGVFNGCANVESITLPFVGVSIKPASAPWQYPFGSIFGSNEYVGGVETRQTHIGSTSSTTTTTSYYIPATLKHVTLNCERIPQGAFYNCSMLTSITLSDCLTDIAKDAFIFCSSLTNVDYLGAIDNWCNITFANDWANPVNYAHDLYIGGNLVIDLVIPETATEIKAYAFRGCSLSSVTISSGVTSIAEKAFARCESLKTVNWNATACAVTGSSSSYLFDGCTELMEINIGDNVTSISSYAFSGCSALTNLTIPNNVISIGRAALAGCGSLTSLTIPFVGARLNVGNGSRYPFGEIFGIDSYTGGRRTVQYYNTGSGAQYDITYYIPGTLTDVTITGGESVRDNAFIGCTSLVNVNIGNDIVNIGNAFLNCSSLKNVTIGSGVTSIVSSTFNYCDVIETITVNENNANYASQDGILYDKEKTRFIFVPHVKGTVTIPDSITSISSSTFRNCSGLTSIIIPNSVTDIGSSAFYGCSGLTSITIPDSVTDIGNGAFQGCNIETATIPTNAIAYIINSALKTVVITSGDCIAESAFVHCTSLTNVTLSDSVESIEKSAFRGCSGLTSVTMANSVTNIGANAFSDCTKLKSIKFNGTKTQWSTIEKGVGWSYGMSNFTVYCYDENVKYS